MDEEIKKYFNELSSSVENEELPQAELVKAGASTATHTKKKIESRNVSDESEGQLTIDVYQTPSHIVIESTIAGVKDEDLDIDITAESVTIKGRREREEMVSGDDYIYQECYWGRFSRSIILPQEIDPENAEATLKNGILTIRLPKIDRQKAKKLRVNLM